MSDYNGWYKKDDEIYTPYKDNAENIRNELIKDIIIPEIKGTLKKNKVINSAIFMVAQYWNDEAGDAVHYQIIYSELDEPNLIAASRFEKKDKHDKVNLPNIINEYNDYYCSLDSEKNNLILDERTFKYWPDNNDAIPAFACFCKEYCHQGMRTLEAYSPYALFKKINYDEISIKIIGKKVRSWIEGVMPNYELKNNI